MVLFTGNALEVEDLPGMVWSVEHGTAEPGNKEAPPYNIPDPPRVATHTVLQPHVLSSVGGGKLLLWL